MQNHNQQQQQQHEDHDDSFLYINDEPEVHRTADGDIVDNDEYDFDTIVERSDPRQLEQILHYCAGVGETKCIRKLLTEKKVDVNCVDPNGLTPLHYASETKALESIDVLIELGANPNAADTEGLSPLHHVVDTTQRDDDNEAVECIQKLVQRGADVNLHAARSGVTPLHLAQHSSTARALLRNGADSNSKEFRYGMSPLHFAAARCNLDVVKVLVQEGNADVNTAAANNGNNNNNSNQQKESPLTPYELSLKSNCDTVAKFLSRYQQQQQQQKQWQQQ